MNQQEINQAEWENPANWTAGSKMLCIYFSHKDSRIWVPKRIPWMGTTLNLAKPEAVAWLTSFILGVPVVIIAIGILIMDAIS